MATPLVTLNDGNSTACLGSGVFKIAPRDTGQAVAIGVRNFEALGFQLGNNDMAALFSLDDGT